MSVNLKTATSIAVGTLASGYVASPTEAAIYTSVAGTAALVTVKLTNNSGAAVDTEVSQIKTGDAGATSNRIFNRDLAAGESMYISGVELDEGDFISGKAGAASAVSVVVSGTLFSSPPAGAVAAGIRVDAIGSGGFAATSGTVDGTNQVGTESGRRLTAALMVALSSGGGGSYTTYDTLGMTCSDGAMTKLVSADLDAAGTKTGSVHLFERANPSPDTLHNLQGFATRAGATFNLTLASLSQVGVDSVTGAVSTGPSAAAALDLSVSSADGHRPIFACAFNDPPSNFSQRVRAFNGSSAVGFTEPHWLILADADGAATVTATTDNSGFHCAVGIDEVPA